MLYNVFSFIVHHDCTERQSHLVYGLQLSLFALVTLPPFSLFFFKIYFMPMDVFPVCVCMFTTFVPGDLEVRRECIELELRIAVNHHVGAGNEI